MKIRNDFVTNSSSTSFIVGLPRNHDTIDTVYNMIRIVVNEMFFIINNVRNNIRECEAFKNVRYIFKLSIYQPSYRLLLYEDYLANQSINELVIKYYNDSLFSICHKDVEEGFIYEIKTELAAPTLEYEYILRYITYNQYIENFTNLELLNVSELDKNDLKMHLIADKFGYFIDSKSVNGYNEFIKQIELIPDIKKFVLDKIGSVVVNVNVDIFSSCFEAIVKYFFSR